MYDKVKLQEDIEYVVKKFKISIAELEKIMSSPIKSHYDYPSYDGWHNNLVKLLKTVGIKK